MAHLEQAAGHQEELASFGALCGNSYRNTSRYNSKIGARRISDTLTKPAEVNTSRLEDFNYDMQAKKVDAARNQKNQLRDDSSTRFGVRLLDQCAADYRMKRLTVWGRYGGFLGKKCCDTFRWMPSRAHRYQKVDLQASASLGQTRRRNDRDAAAKLHAAHQTIWTLGCQLAVPAWNSYGSSCSIQEHMTLISPRSKTAHIGPRARTFF